MPKCIKVLFFLSILLTSFVSTAGKQRIFVLTDIENEPDDAMSMVRLLVYANHFDIEGLAATTSIHQRDEVATYRIREIVEAYGKVRDNLEKHERGFPMQTICGPLSLKGYLSMGSEPSGRVKIHRHPNH